MPEIILKAGENLSQEKMSEAVGESLFSLVHPDKREDLRSRYKDAIKGVPDQLIGALYDINSNLALNCLTLIAFYDFKIDPTEDPVSLKKRVENKTASLQKNSFFQTQKANLKTLIEDTNYYEAVCAPRYLKGLFDGLISFIPRVHAIQAVHYYTPDSAQLQFSIDPKTKEPSITATLKIQGTYNPKTRQSEKILVTLDEGGDNAVAVAQEFAKLVNEINFTFSFDLKNTEPQANLLSISASGTQKWCDALEIMLSRHDLVNFKNENLKTTTQLSGHKFNLLGGRQILENYAQYGKNAESASFLKTLFDFNQILDTVIAKSGNVSDHTLQNISNELDAAEKFFAEVVAPFQQRIDKVKSQHESSIVGWMHPMTEEKQQKLAKLEDTIKEIQKAYQTYYEQASQLLIQTTSKAAVKLTQLPEELKKLQYDFIRSVNTIVNEPQLEETLGTPRHPHLEESIFGKSATKSGDALKDAREVVKTALKELAVEEISSASTESLKDTMKTSSGGSSRSFSD